MRFKHLIESIKDTIAEGRGGTGVSIASQPNQSSKSIPNFGGNLGRAMAPKPAAPSAPPTTGGATFGGAMAQAGRYMSATNSSNKATNAMNVARGSVGKFGPTDTTMKSSSQTKVASSTQTKPTATSTPKPTPLQKASAKAATKRTTQIKRPMKRPTRTTASDDFNNNMQRSMGNLEEHRTLIETVKKLAKKKNSKCDTEEGDNPKGAPDRFELNPEINSSIQNR